MTMSRGVFLPPIVTSKMGNNLSFGTVGDLPFLDMAPFAILYWDKIFAPIAIAGSIPMYDAAVEKMVSLGIAESISLKEQNRFSTSDIRGMIEKHSAAFQAINSREDELWSVLPLITDKELSLADQTSVYFPKTSSPVTSIELSLMQALPVPMGIFDYEELLEFKLKRSDQLARLHVEISSLSIKFANACDSKDALKRALESLSVAIKDVERVHDERWSEKSLRTLSTAFLLEGAIPAIATYAFGLPLDKAFIVGSGLAVAKSYIGSLQTKEKYKNHPYAYASDVIRCLK